MKNTKPTYQELEKQIAELKKQNEVSTDLFTKEDAEHSEEKYSKIINATPDGIIITALDGTIQFLNEKSISMWGYNSGDEIIGRNALEFIHSSCHEKTFSLRNEVLQGKLIGSTDFLMVRKDGSQFYTEANVAPLMDANNSPIGVLHIQRDVTQRKEIEQELLDLNNSLEVKITERTKKLTKANNELLEKDELRQNLQKSLIESQKKYQNVLDNVNEVLFETDAQGLWLFLNKAWETITGFSVEESLNQLFVNYVHPDDRERNQALFEPMINREKEYCRHVVRYLTKSGGYRWIEVFAKLAVDENDEITGTIGTLQDVTDRKQIEEELAVQTERLTYIIEGTDVGTWEWHVQTGEVIFNDRYANILGYTLEELAPISIDTWTSLTHPDDLAVAQELLEQHFKGELENYSVEMRMKNKQGEWLWLLDRGKVSKWDEDGKPLLMSGTHSDINDRKITEEQLADEKQRLASILEGTDAGTWETNLESGETLYNERWANIIGYTLEELYPIDKNTFRKLAHPDDLKIAEERLEQHYKGELDYYDVESRMKHKNGEWIWVLARGKISQRDDTGKPLAISGIVLDITEQKRKEEELIWNKSLLELMSNSSPLGFLVVDNRTDDILYFNHQFTKIWEIEHIEEQMHRGELKNNDIIPYCLPVLANVPAFAASCEPLQYEENRLVLSDDIAFTNNRTIHRYTTQIRSENDDYFGRFYIFEDITDRKQSALFENNLLELSIEMTATESTNIGSAINKNLAKIGSFLTADRAYIFEITEDGSDMSNTYEWCNEGVTPEIENLQGLPVAIFPEWIKSLKNKENVHIPSIQDLPETWSAEREILEPQGIQSLVAIPILNFNKLIGFVGLDSVKKAKTYTESEIKNLRVWANMMAGILNKQKADHLLDQTRINHETYFNTIDQFLFVVDENTNIIHINNTVTNRLGYTREELISESILKVHPADRRQEAKIVTGEMLDGTTAISPVPFQTKNGELISVETRITKGFWNGKPVTFGVAKDVSELKLSEEKFSKAFQSNSGLMAIAGLDGKFIDVNTTFLNTIGFSRDEVIGKDPVELQLFDEDTLEAISMENAEKNLPEKDFELEIKIKSGAMISVLVSTDAIYIGKDKCFLAMAVNITHRKAAEAEILNARNEAENANLAKSEYLSRMSHELRTPLNSILGFTQLMEMGETNEPKKKRLAQVLNSGKHLLNLINDVLNISGIEKGKLEETIEPILLSEKINQAVDLVQGIAFKSNVEIVVENSPANLLFVNFDKIRLKQVFINLLSNAVKYNKAGGNVTVKTELLPSTSSELPFIRVSVTDSGIGIKPEDIEKIFNPFERIGADKTDIEGTGLGLSVVQKIMKSMGGDFGVNSEIGVGSTFWIELQQTTSENSPIEVQRRKTLRKRISSGDTSPTILYVESNDSGIKLVQEILMEYRPSTQLITTNYGKQALHLAKKHKVNLILLDLNLPDIKGDEVLKKLLANSKTMTIPVVMISADAMPNQVHRLIKAGAAHYLTKPIDLLQLLQIIDTYTRV